MIAGTRGPYDLDLHYSVAPNRLRGRATVTVVAREAVRSLDLDLAGLRVTKVEVDGRPARWRHAGTKLHVTPAEPLAAGVAVEVVVRYEGNPRPVRSPWGPVGWEELTDGSLVAAQPSGACTWFPCNDQARQKATFRTTITTGATYVAVVNGALIDERRAGSTRTWTYEQVEPTSPYLMTVHIGRYEAMELAAAPVRVVAHAAGAHRAATASVFARQVEMVDAFTDRFVPYPFAAGYAVVVCPEPLEIPLEAQGQAVFGTNHLDGAHERLIAHELAHQWFGNSLTASTWRDIWLHEGFACYAEWLWSEASGGEPAATHAAEHHARLRDLPQDLVLADPGVEDLFDDRVYKRGALTLHASRGELGDDRFFGLLRRWTADHRHGLVTSEAFEAAASAAAGRPLDALFDAWLRTADLP